VKDAFTACAESSKAFLAKDCLVFQGKKSYESRRDFPYFCFVSLGYWAGRIGVVQCLLQEKWAAITLRLRLLRPRVGKAIV